MCRLCVSNVFGARAGFYMDVSHSFPQCVLAAITFIGGVVGFGRSKACAGCEVGVPLCLMAVTVLSWAQSAPQLLE